jgi:excisionase family DNA binding protein
MKNEEKIDLRMESLVNAAQVAEMLGLCHRTVQDMAARGELPVYKIGRLNRFRVREILDWTDQRKVPSFERSHF